MSFLEDMDKRSLLEGEDELKDRTIEGFVEIIRRRFSLARVTYVCPSFGGRERKDSS
jgi:LuxR family quorum-sensing system transcriptional regulator SinR